MAHHCRSLLDPPYKPMNNPAYPDLLLREDVGQNECQSQGGNA
jgi:hypothetical protein